MGILKKEPNPVGRPSKESLKKKRNQKILVGILATVAVLLVGGTVLLIATGTDLTQLMGNSVTKGVQKVCPKYFVQKIDKNGLCSEQSIDNVIVETDVKYECSTGTLMDDDCVKKISTKTLSNYYNKACPKNTDDGKTKVIYKRSNQYSCTETTYEILEPAKRIFECPKSDEQWTYYKGFSSCYAHPTPQKPLNFEFTNDIKVKMNYEQMTSKNKVVYNLVINGGYKASSSKEKIANNIQKYISEKVEFGYRVIIKNTASGEKLYEFSLDENVNKTVEFDRNQNVIVEVYPYLRDVFAGTAKTNKIKVGSLNVMARGYKRLISKGNIPNS